MQAFARAVVASKPRDPSASTRPKRKKIRPYYVVVSQIRRVLTLRYPPDGYPIIESPLARDRLQAFVDHKVLAGTQSFLELRGIVRNFAPWMEEAEQDRLLQTCIDQPRRWTNFKLGKLFDVTAEERGKEKLWQMWPAGFTVEQAKRHRLVYKAEHERRKRRERAAEERAKSRAAYDDPKLSEHEKAVYGQIGATWLLASKIKAELRTWTAYRQQSSQNMRQIVSRALRGLEKKDLIERDATPLKSALVRRR